MNIHRLVTIILIETKKSCSSSPNHFNLNLVTVLNLTLSDQTHFAAHNGLHTLKREVLFAPDKIVCCLTSQVQMPFLVCVCLGKSKT